MVGSNPWNDRYCARADILISYGIASLTKTFILE